MADKVITLTIPDAKVAVALQGFLGIYPNDEMTNDDPPVAKYTNQEWVTEKVRRLVVKDIRRGLQKIANEAANVAEDDGIVTT